jgi:hypothetical protein
MNEPDHTTHSTHSTDTKPQFNTDVIKSPISSTPSVNVEQKTPTKNYMDMGKLAEHSSERKSYFPTPSARSAISAPKSAPSRSGGFMNMSKLSRK